MRLVPEDLTASWGEKMWGVCDYGHMRGDAPTVVEVGFRTKKAAEEYIRDVRAGKIDLAVEVGR